MSKLLLTTALAIIPISAFAADLPKRAAAPAPAPAFVAAPSWAGFYVGAQLGWTHGKVKAEAEDNSQFDIAYPDPQLPNFQPLGPQSSLLPSTSFNGDGLIGGVYAGHNWQVKSLVLGVEFDGNLSGLKKTTEIGSLGVSVSARSTYEAGIVGKVGVTFDRALFYVLAGASVANYKSRSSLGKEMLDAVNDNLTGWTIGAGVAVKINQNWSGRVEYRYTDYGKYSSENDYASITRHIQTHRVMAGASYHFSAPSRPAVARY